LVNPATYRLWLQSPVGTAELDSAFSAAGLVATASRPLDINNLLGTANVVPAFSSNWYANLYVGTYSAQQLSLLYNQDPPARGATVDFSVRLGTAVTITAGQTSYTITHGLGVSTVIIPTVNWNTPVYITSRGATQHVIKFAVEPYAPSLLWWATHADSTDVIGSAEAITDGAATHTIRHNQGQIGPFFWLTSWPTTAKIHTRDENTVTLAFQVEAPPGATIDWRAKKPSAS
jgi:hypothetical protein